MHYGTALFRKYAKLRVALFYSRGNTACGKFGIFQAGIGFIGK